MQRHHAGECRAGGRPARVLIVGTSGSGKTTLARRLARTLGVPHIELDALHWEPNWTEAADGVLASRLADALAAAPDGWVVDGNYLTKTAPQTWPNADTVVFLDFPLPLILVRLTRRTIRRSRTQEELWSGNRERLRTLVSRDSLLWWAVKTHGRNRRRYRARMHDPDWQHLRVIRLRRVDEIERYLASVAGR
jgi:adenylate kinase family enzyme